MLCVFSLPQGLLPRTKGCSMWVQEPYVRGGLERSKTYKERLRGHGGRGLHLLQPCRHVSPWVFGAGPHTLYWSFDEKLSDSLLVYGHFSPGWPANGQVGVLVRM